MISTIVTILIIISMTSRFYLKYTPMKSFSTVMAAIIGVITAFSFYEILASLLISRGYLAQWAQAICFFTIFLAVSIILETLMGYIVGENIDFGKPAKISTAIICGIISGIIISGVVDITSGLSPTRRSNPYSRFGDQIDVSQVSRPSKSLIPSDDFVAGLYKMVSKGALSSNKRFDVVHANYVDQLHLNRFAAEDEVAIVSADDAVFVDKYGVRKKEMPGGEIRTVIELHVKTKAIEDGGAMDANKKLSFSLSQIRIVCAPEQESEITGKNIKVLYPEKYFIKGQTVKEDIRLSDIIDFPRDTFVQTAKGKAARLDLSFDVPESLSPKFLQFKANCNVKLPKLVTQEEIDAAELERANNPEPEKSSS